MKHTSIQVFTLPLLVSGSKSCGDHERTTIPGLIGMPIVHQSPASLFLRKRMWGVEYSMIAVVLSNSDGLKKSKTR